MVHIYDSRRVSYRTVERFVKGPNGVVCQIAMKHLRIVRIITSDEKLESENEAVNVY